jgi:hypothetical protein
MIELLNWNQEIQEPITQKKKPMHLTNRMFARMLHSEELHNI